MLDEVERADLLRLARRSIARGLDGTGLEPPAGDWSPALSQQRATFTTLMLKDELRGCCGSIEPQRSLFLDVWHAAWSSAYADPRFLPVSAAEIERLEISISVLTPLEPIEARSDAELIRSLGPGVDGLVLCRGARRVTFLPAVWKTLPDPADFVAELKMKAGWSSSARLSDLKCFRYQTETFRSACEEALRRPATSSIPGPEISTM